MHLLDIIQRAAQPEPWSEGDNSPWNDPAFSARMLKEHLSQAHDAASRFAALGHTCTGIDFSPASIEYARSQAAENCAYTLADLRQADYGRDPAMLIFEELNVFRPAGARLILRKVHAALKPGGLLLEPHTFDLVREIGQKSSSWYSARHTPRQHAYTDDDYRALLTECGFDRIVFYPALVESGDFQPGLQVITARSYIA